MAENEVKKTVKKAVKKIEGAAKKVEKAVEHAAKPVAAKPKAEKPAPTTARIINFRRGRHTQRNNQMLIEVEGVMGKTLASGYIGRRVVWTTPGGRQIHGKITAPHGSKGVLRVRFSQGMPGDALTQKVKVA